MLNIINNKFVDDNRKGLDIMEELTDLKSRIEEHEKQFAVFENEIKRLRLESEGRWLQQQQEQEREQEEEEEEKEEGEEEVEVVLYGNAVADAYLFKHDNRLDFRTYSDLYGFQYPQVLQYCKKLSFLFFDKKLIILVYEGIEGGIFSVLNAHAALLAQGAKGKAISSEFKGAFRKFIVTTEDSYPLTPMSDDHNGPLARAYLEFWRLHKQERTNLQSFC